MKDRVYDEWCQYQEEEIPRDLFVLSEGQNENVTGYMKYRKIDECWYRVLQITNTRGEAKYQTLSMIVKIAYRMTRLMWSMASAQISTSWKTEQF